MRTTLILVLLARFAVGTASAGAAPSRSWTHTRPVTPGARTLLADATCHSVIVRSLLAALERTDIIVYLSDRMSEFDGEPRAYLTFLARASGARYVLVCINPISSPPPGGVALLAHELQHALEVAQAPEVHDSASLAGLYRRIGWKHCKRQFESERALRTERRVWYELTGRVR